MTDPIEPKPEPMPLKTILLAEDDPVLRKLYSHVLKLAGYDVASAADGVEALEIAGRQSFDLMIIDVMMPKMDGLDLCRHLKKKFGNRTPVVFLTALDDADTLRRCTDAGADDYLVKEGSPDGLVRRVDYWRRLKAGTLRNFEIRPGLAEQAAARS